MWFIIVVLSVGILIGALINPTDKIKKINSRMQHLGVVILLFAMGAGLGLNDQLLSNLKDIGWIAFVFALFTTIGSISIVFILSKAIMKGK